MNHGSNYISTSDTELLLNVLKKIIEHPHETKFQNINLTKLRNKLNNYEMCMDILNEAGFKVTDDGLRIIFDNTRHHQLQSVHFNILSMKVFNSNEYISNNHKSKIDIDIDTEVNRNENKQYGIKCDLSECLCLKDITNILNKYKSYIDTCENEQKQVCINEDVYNRKENKYSSVDLLNDFNHLIQSHSVESQHIFKYLKWKIYNNNDCESSECLLMRRHNRDRHRISENEKILTELYFTNDDIVCQQLLDRVHCHYFHSFGIGYQQSKNTNIAIDQNKIYKKSNDSKIISKYKQSKLIFNYEYGQFSYGHRFYYWNPYLYAFHIEDPVVMGQTTSYSTESSSAFSSDAPAVWYVRSKHKCIKTELLNNHICRIGSVQWQSLYDKAAQHYQTVAAKDIFCKRNITASFYEMKYEESITLNHLIAMSTYCNFDKLSFKFSETYRKININETDIELRERHRNYYWLGRYLRECVECFGMDRKALGLKHSDSMTVYHGANKQFLFPSIYTHIMGPFSTTKSYSVAVNFCNNEGHILKLSMAWFQWQLHSRDAFDTLSCCDMSWISDFSAEQEIFCVGGLGIFCFETVIEPKTCINYVKYITALKQITRCLDVSANVVRLYEQFDDRCDSNESKSDRVSPVRLRVKWSQQQRLMNFRLLSHQIWKLCPQNAKAYRFEGCPEYINNIMDLHFKNITNVQLIHDSKLIHYFFKYENGWIIIELLCKILPNIEEIRHSYVSIKDLSVLKDALIYESVLSFIEWNKSTKLRHIELTIPVKYYQEMKQFIIRYQQRFNNFKWKIEVKNLEDYKDEFSNLGIQYQQHMRLMNWLLGTATNETERALIRTNMTVVWIDIATINQPNADMWSFLNNNKL
eukprot:219292_1